MTQARLGGAPPREEVSFFKQSGWMLFCTVVGGICFALVHVPASRMSPTSKAEWGLFATLLDSLYLLAIPAGGMQAVFAQMTASAVTARQRDEVRGAVRQALLGVTLIWLVVVAGAWVWQERLVTGLRMSRPAALWLTLGVGLVGLWLPVFLGLLQGSQRFFWLGLSQVSSAVGRLGGIAVAVMLLGGLAAGAMAGVLAGVCLQLGLAIWASRHEWGGAVQRAAWGPWLGRLLGLTLGLAPTSVLLAGDSLLVQSVFGEEGKDLYLAAGRVGRGLVNLTTPLAIVLFPKIARSTATGESTRALGLALGAALSVGVAAALGCTLFPRLTLQVLFGGNPAFLGASGLVPWFAWAMLPLTAAYTLINNLLARGEYRVVLPLLAVAAGYAGTLAWMAPWLAGRPMVDAFRMVILALGGFSLLLLAVAAVYSFRSAAAAKAAPPA